MLDILIKVLEDGVKTCANTKDKAIKSAIYDQTYGACQYHALMFPNDQKQVDDLWGVYRLQFGRIICE